MNRRYVLLLVSLSFLFPFHTYFEIGSFRVNTSLGDFIVVVTILLVLLGVISVRYLPRYTVVLSVFLSFLALSVIINLITGVPAYYSSSLSILELIKLIGAVIWFVTVYVLFSYNPRHALWLFGFISVFLATFFSIVSFYEISVLGVSRPIGPFENPNIFANYLAFNLFLALSLMRLREERVISLLLIAVIIFGGILSTASRGGIFGMVAGFCFLLLYHISRQEGWWLLKYTPAAIFLVPIFWFWRDTSGFQIISRTLANPRGQASMRIERWEYAIEAFIDNPLFGLGYGQFAQATPSTTGVHNTLLSIGTEAGIFAVGFFALFMVLVFTDGIRLSYNTRNHHLIFLVGFLVAAMVQGLVTDVYKFRTLWITIGILSVYYHFHQEIGNVNQ